MTELSQADRILLDGIRQGDAEAWGQLVDRYRGRLLAFARSRLSSPADAEDLLQETFMTFLKTLPAFREQASIETYLFAILRRRVVDWYRGRRGSVCLLHDVIHPDEDDSAEPIARLPSSGPTASWYARRNEQDDILREVLADAVRELINAFKKDLNFRDLKMIEMLFYCQIANKDVARIAGVDEKRVALLKHRSLNKVREAVARGIRRRGRQFAAGGLRDYSDALLSDVWETLRLSCPKRSTIGAYLLGTLDADWHDYVDCHLNKLGCRFCLANLEDLRHKTASEAGGKALRDRILKSTVGFLRQSYRGHTG